MKRLLAAVVVSTLAVPAAAANLLINGDFEMPSTPAGSFTGFGGGDSFPGWTLLGPPGNAVALLNTAYAEAGIAFQAQSGSASMDLTGVTNTGSSSGVEQAVQTIAGQSYALSFWVGNADGSGNSNYLLPSTVRLSIDGGPLQDFTNADISPLSTNWKFFAISFVAAGPSTVLSFFNGTDLADAETGLDNVVLSGPAVPEPSTWMVLLLGFALTGAALRRRATGATIG